MEQDPAFVDLMGRVRVGDELAAAAVVERFTRRLIELARSHLDPLLRRKIDPEDVLQSVYRSFFHHHAQGQYHLENWDGLWAMLVVMTLGRCGYHRDFFRAARRDMQREAGLPDADDSVSSLALLARDPSPEEAALLAETIERLMQGLTPREQEILDLALRGCSSAEISARVARSERTVQRLLKRVRQRLETMRAEESRHA